jgi:transposase-like protein
MKTQEIIRLYVDEKKSLVATAKVLGMAPKTVRKRLLENGHEIRSKNATREAAISEDVLRDMYVGRKMSCAAIAEDLGVAHGTVHNYLKKYGLNNRSAVVSKSGDDYTLWDTERLEKCRQLLLEHRSYQVVAELLKCTPSAVENKNRDNWQIPMSIWSEREDEIKSYLEKTRNYAETAFKFDVSEQALWCKNQKSWNIDLSMNSTRFGIPTEYNGTLYRSKKESIIARYLNERNITFEYERKVKEGHNWTCDFYLPDYDLWVEYDGLEIEREATKSVPYNRDNNKIRYYQENAFHHMILGKRTWKKQLDGFFDGHKMKILTKDEMKTMDCPYPPEEGYSVLSD